MLCSLLSSVVVPAGQYLKQCGVAEVKIGQALTQFHERVERDFVTPLKAFLEVDIKNAMVGGWLLM